MSEEDNITRDDIPEVDSLKAALLAELASGRARSFKAVQKDAEAALKLSTRQRRYKIKGSKTTLLANRFEKARAELKAEGLIEYPEPGKIKLAHSAGNPKGKHANPGKPIGEDAERSADNAPEKAGGAASSDSARGDARHAASPAPERAGDHVADSPSTGNATPLSETTPQSPLPARSANDSGATSGKPDTAPAYTAATPAGAWAKCRKFAPVALVVLGIVLCLARCGLPGAIFGGAGLFLRAKDSKSDVADNPAAPKATLWAGVASILLGIVLAFSSCSGSAPSEPADQHDAPASPPASTQASDEAASGALSFKVAAPDWPDKSKPVQVSVEGETADGKAVSDHYEALVGTAYALEYGKGNYTLTVAQGSLVCNDVPFTASPSTCAFDGKRDRVVTLSLAKDEKALAAQEAEKQKEAEAAAQAEAEAKAQAEAEAAAQAEAERQAAEEAAAAEAAAAAAAIVQAESAAAEADSSGGGEYIGNVNSHKFHRPTCSTPPAEKNRVYFSSRDEAINAGYVPCKNCNP